MSTHDHIETRSLASGLSSPQWRDGRSPRSRTDGACCGPRCCEYCRYSTRDHKEDVAKRCCGGGFVTFTIAIILTVVFGDISDPVFNLKMHRSETRLLSVPDPALFQSVEISESDPPHVPTAAISVYSSTAETAPPLTGPRAVLSWSESGDLIPAGELKTFHFFLNAGSYATFVSRADPGANVYAVIGEENWSSFDDARATQYAELTFLPPRTTLVIDAVAAYNNTNPNELPHAARESLPHWVVYQNKLQAVTLNVAPTLNLTTHDLTGLTLSSHGQTDTFVMLDGSSSGDIRWLVLAADNRVDTAGEDGMHDVVVTHHYRMFASGGARIAIVWLVTVLAIMLWVAVEVWYAKRVYDGPSHDVDAHLINQTIGEAFE